MPKCKCCREDYATTKVMNAKSLRKIRNIVANARRHQYYANLEIKSYAESRGIRCIDISNNGHLINKFVFCPDTEGNIESIAIYGDNLRSHINAIRQSMKIFDMEVEDVDFESGYSDYVDVYLKNE